MKLKLTKTSFGTLVISCFVVFSISCGQNNGPLDTPNPPRPVVEVPAERLYLGSPTQELHVGNSYTINPVVFPYNAKQNVKYIIENNDVIKVENNQAIGKSEGTSLITVYNDEDNDDTLDSNEVSNVMGFSIVNEDPNVRVVIEDNNVTLSVGESKKLTYGVEGATPSGLDYGFYSDNEEICTISSGIVKAHKAGTTRVSVSWQGYRGYANITVNDYQDDKGLHASGISIDEENIVLSVGQSHKIKYSVYPEGSIEKVDSFRSNNSKVATVDSNGFVTAKKDGSAIITLKTSNNKINRILVVVKSANNDENSYYNNYYGNLTWENGEDLKQKLHNIISQNVTPLKYEGTNWETNQFADQDLYNHDALDVVYNYNTVDKSNTTIGWQREHAFAASLMTGFSTGQAVKSLGRSTDFHNLFAASSGANGSRGNKNLGYANPDIAGYDTKEECGFVRKAFEPGDNDKGRLARAIFYMGVMYNTVENAEIPETWTYSGDDVSTHSGKTTTVRSNVSELPLQIVEKDVEYNRISLNEFMNPTKRQNQVYVDYYLNQITDDDLSYDEKRQAAYVMYLNTSMPYAIGHLSELIKWNSFSVDYVEMQHNDSVYSHNSAQGSGTQGNRNPFVDYPQLVDYVYGDLRFESGSLKDLTPSYVTLEMGKNEIHHYAYNASNVPTFKAGTKASASELGIKAIKYDLTETNVDYSKIKVEDYTFKDEDATTGKLLRVDTDKNTLFIVVNVASATNVTFETCSWSYTPTTGNKSDYTGSGTSWTADFGGQLFDVTFGKSTSVFNNKNTPAPPGVTIGSSNNNISSFTLTSQSSCSNVNAVYFYAGASTGTATFNYTISVNNVQVLSGTFGGNTPTYNGGMFAKTSGVISLSITNINSGLVFCGFAYNVVN